MDPTRDVAVRTCAAVANARLGFPHGEDFCFAVLRAGLLSSKDSDREHALPESDRLAFAREIALDWLRERFQVVILSDTYYEFALPLMRQLDWPTLFCHRLEVVDDHVVGYVLRQPDSKRQAVQAFHQLNFRVIAAGDSYNDTAMLAEAEAGILFRPPQNVIDEFPQFPVARTFAEMREAFRQASVRSL